MSVALAAAALVLAADLSQWDPAVSPESLLLLAHTVCRRGNLDLGARLLRHARRHGATLDPAWAPMAARACGSVDRAPGRTARGSGDRRG